MDDPLRSHSLSIPKQLQQRQIQDSDQLLPAVLLLGNIIYFYSSFVRSNKKDFPSNSIKYLFTGDYMGDNIQSVPSFNSQTVPVYSIEKIEKS